MTTSSDHWPPYHSGLSKHVHALGVISLEFNRFESAFFPIFSHHLTCRGLDASACWSIFSGLPESKYQQTIRALFQKYEKDPAVHDHLEHSFTHFNRCNDARNWLMHSVHSVITQDVLQLHKAVKTDFEPLHILRLSLDELRRVADDMHAGNTYMTKLFIYLVRRDGMLEETDAIMALLGPRALPEKPDLPHTLSPSQISRLQADIWFPPPPSDE